MALNVGTQFHSENMPLEPFSSHNFKTAFPVSLVLKINLVSTAVLF